MANLDERMLVCFLSLKGACVISDLKSNPDLQELLHHPFLSCVNLEEAFYAPLDDVKQKFAQSVPAETGGEAVEANCRGAGANAFETVLEPCLRQEAHKFSAHPGKRGQKRVERDFLLDDDPTPPGNISMRGGGTRESDKDSSPGGAKGKKTRDKDRLKKKKKMEKGDSKPKGGSPSENEANKKKRKVIKISELRGEF